MEKNKGVFKSRIRLKGESNSIEGGVSKGRERFEPGSNF